MQEGIFTDKIALDKLFHAAKTTEVFTYPCLKLVQVKYTPGIYGVSGILFQTWIWFLCITYPEIRIDGRPHTIPFCMCVTYTRFHCDDWSSHNYIPN